MQHVDSTLSEDRKARDYLILDDFLDEKTFKDLQTQAMETPAVQDQKTKGWGMDIIRDSAPVKISKEFWEEKTDAMRKVEALVRATEYGRFAENQICAMLFYHWGPGSYIPWHDDSRHGLGFTLYLNDEWNMNWGGELILAPVGIDQGVWVMPKANRIAILGNRLPHKTAIVASSAQNRITLQGFFPRN